MERNRPGPPSDPMVLGDGKILLSGIGFADWNSPPCTENGPRVLDWWADLMPSGSGNGELAHVECPFCMLASKPSTKSALQSSCGVTDNGKLCRASSHHSMCHPTSPGPLAGAILHEFCTLEAPAAYCVPSCACLPFVGKEA